MNGSRDVMMGGKEREREEGTTRDCDSTALLTVGGELEVEEESMIRARRKVGCGCSWCLGEPTAGPLL